MLAGTGAVRLTHSGPITVLSREGRRTLPTVEVQGQQMVGLDDLAESLPAAGSRDDRGHARVTATYKNQTIVLTPDQSLVSASGRLVSLPAPLTRRANRWLVPVEFISRALAPIYDVTARFPPGVATARRRRSSRAARHGAVRRQPGALRVTFEIAPRATAVVTQEQSRLLVRFDADALDASLPPPPSQQGLLIGIRAVDADDDPDGSRSAVQRVSHASPPASSGAARHLTIELLARR